MDTERPEFKGKEIKGDVRGEGQAKPSIDGDLVITVQKNADGILSSPRMRVYCKDADGDLHQIGMLQKLSLEADVNDFEVSAKAKLAMEMPAMTTETKRSLQTYKGLLQHVGVTLDLCTCEVTEGGLGVDPECPVHTVK